MTGAFNCDYVIPVIYYDISTLWSLANIGFYLDIPHLNDYAGLMGVKCRFLKIKEAY